jgi:TrmH RNA methyltransferase
MNSDVICGLNAVSALFSRRPGDVLRLFYAPPLKQQAGPFCALLAKARKPFRSVPAEELATIAGTSHHGGIAAVAAPRYVPYLDPGDPPAVPLLLALDGVGNPHNLGAIARSAAFFGVRAILIGEGGAMPSNAVYRVAEGGLEHLEVFRTKDLAGDLEGMGARYRRIAAVSSADGTPVQEVPRDRPIALVLGGEERGVSQAVLARCRRHVRIGGSGLVESLNVAQAAAVLLHRLTS